jgi:hypothetical protein
VQHFPQSPGMDQTKLYRRNPEFITKQTKQEKHKSNKTQKSTELSFKKAVYTLLLMFVFVRQEFYYIE